MHHCIYYNLFTAFNIYLEDHQIHNAMYHWKYYILFTALKIHLYNYQIYLKNNDVVLKEDNEVSTEGIGYHNSATKTTSLKYVYDTSTP